MKPTVPLLLSVNGGHVDTAGYLALQGLFTAHVTGNFVTLGAALVQGTSGAVAKLLALPMFCAVVIATRLFSSRLPDARIVIQARLARMSMSVGAFAAGCAAAALSYAFHGTWCFVVPPILAICALCLPDAAPPRSPA